MYCTNEQKVMVLFQILNDIPDFEKLLLKYGDYQKISNFINKLQYKRNQQFISSFNNFGANQHTKKLSYQYKDKIPQNMLFIGKEFIMQRQEYQTETALKNSIFKSIKAYIKMICSQFTTNQYYDYKEKQVSYKQYFSLNLVLNIFAMIQTLYLNLIQPYVTKKKVSQQVRKELRKMLHWLIQTIEQILANQLSKEQKNFQNNANQLKKSNEIDEIDRKKKCFSKRLIDRRQNQWYDFLIINNITYKNQQSLIIQVFAKIIKLSNNRESQDINSLMAYLLWEEQIKEQINMSFHQFLSDIQIQKRLLQKRNSQRDTLKKIRIEKLQVPNQIKSFKQLRELVFKEENIHLASSFQRIITKFISNLLNLINDPKLRTTKRKYPYKNLKNQHVYNDPYLSSKLQQNLQKLKKGLKQKQSQYQRVNNIKQQYLKEQCKIIHEKIDYRYGFLYRQKLISAQIFKAGFNYSLSLLSQLIRLIIKAGKVQDRQGNIHEINLITFNIGDLFRAKQVTTVEQFQIIVNRIYRLQEQQPELFKIIRIKDKLDSPQQNLLINFLYRNKVQCQIQINSKKAYKKQIHKISHLLYQIYRGQFGILFQMAGIVQSNYDKKKHRYQLFFLQSVNNKQKKIPIWDQQMKDQSREDKSFKHIWTDIFYHLQQIKDKQSQNNQYSEVIQNLGSLQQYKKIKYIKHIGIYQQYQKQFNLSKLDIFTHLQTLALCRFYKKNNYQFTTNLIIEEKNTCFQKIKYLNLSNNYLNDFNLIQKSAQFKQLKQLILSNNLFNDKLELFIQRFPQLILFNISSNVYISQIIVKQKQKDVSQNQNHILSQNSQIQKIEYKIFFAYLQEKIICKRYKDDKVIFKVITAENKEKLEIQCFNKCPEQDKKPRKNKRKIKSIPKREYDFEFKQLKYHMSKFKDAMRKLTGKLILKSKKSLKSHYFMIEKNILVTCAHSILSQQYHQEWNEKILNKESINQIKQKIKSLYLIQIPDSQNSKIEQKYLEINDFWIHPQYIKNKNQLKDICLLYVEMKYPQNIFTNISVIYKPESTVTKVNCSLYSYIFGHLDPNIISNFYFNICLVNSNHQGALLLNKTFKQGRSGTPICYIEITGKYSYRINFLGIYSSFNTQHQYGKGLFIDQRVREQILNKLHLSKQQTRIQRIQYQVYSKFVQDSKTSNCLFNIIDYNKLQLLREAFLKLISLLENYLFIKGNNYTEQQILKKIYIYNFKETRANSYDVDFRGFQIKYILSQITKNNRQTEIIDLDRINKQIEKSQQQNFQFTIKLVNALIEHCSSQQIEEKKVLEEIKRQLEKQYSLKRYSFLIIILRLYSNSSALNSQIQMTQQFRYAYEQTDEKKQNKIYNILINSNAFKKISSFSQLIRIIENTATFKEKKNNSLIPANTDQNYKDQQQFLKISFHREIIQSNNFYLKLLRNILSSKMPLKNQSVVSQKIKLIVQSISSVLQVNYLMIVLRQIYQIQPQQKFNDQLIEKFYIKNKQQLRKQLLNMRKQLLNMIQVKWTEQIDVSFYQYSLLDISSIQTIKNNIKNQLSNQLDLLLDATKLMISKQIVSKDRKDIDKTLQSLASQIQQKQKKLIPQNQPKQQKTLQKINIKAAKIQHNQPTNLKSNQYPKIQQRMGKIIVDDNNYLMQDTADKDKVKFIGTGVILGTKYVLTVAHNVNQFVYANFPKGKIRFVLGENQQINVVQVYAIISRDIAVLVLQDKIKFKSQLPLIIHDKNFLRSNFNGTTYFCQIIGYIRQQSKEVLKISQGMVTFQQNIQGTISYKIFTNQGQSGGIIVIYPTGDINEPYIVGLHHGGYEGRSDQFGFNSQQYFADKSNTGLKITQELFIKNSKQSVCFYAKDYNNIENEQFDFLRIHENHFLFSTELYNLNKWKFIRNYNSKFSREHIQSLLKKQITHYSSNQLLLTQIKPENLLYYNTSTERALFDVKVIYSEYSTSSKSKQIITKNAYEQAINGYTMNTQSLKIVQCLQYQNYQKLIENFSVKVDKIKQIAKGLDNQRNSLNFSGQKVNTLLFFMNTLETLKNKINSIKSLNDLIDQQQDILVMKQNISNFIGQRLSIISAQIEGFDIKLEKILGEYKNYLKQTNTSSIYLQSNKISEQEQTYVKSENIEKQKNWIEESILKFQQDIRFSNLSRAEIVFECSNLNKVKSKLIEKNQSLSKNCDQLKALLQQRKDKKQYKKKEKSVQNQKFLDKIEQIDKFINQQQIFIDWIVKKINEIQKYLNRPFKRTFQNKLPLQENFKLFLEYYYNDQKKFDNYLQSFTNSKDEKKVMQFGIKYLSLKIIYSAIYFLYEFFRENRIIFSQEYKFQLAVFYKFDGKKQLYSKQTDSKDTIENQYKKQISKRAKSIYMIQSFQNLGDQRAYLFQQVLNWKMIKQIWKKRLQSYKQPDHSVKQDIEWQDIIKTICEQYHYLNKGYNHSINIGRIVIEELNLFKQLCEEYKLLQKLKQIND